jgi:toxin ParE1/3/4
MAKVTLRQAAIDDLNAIWEYTFEEWSEEQADRYYTALKLACNQISEYPQSGKKYEEIESDLFGLRSGKHIVFFKVLNDQDIEVVRILHERMDLKNRLS